MHYSDHLLPKNKFQPHMLCQAVQAECAVAGGQADPLPHVCAAKIHAGLWQHRHVRPCGTTPQRGAPRRCHPQLRLRSAPAAAPLARSGAPRAALSTGPKPSPRSRRKELLEAV